MSNKEGVLYVVATPIGNLSDLSPRGAEILRRVDGIACEDTRHSGRLLKEIDARAPLTALHEHNERKQAPKLLARLREGERIALISDAGTPLLSDPGFHLVGEARRAGIRVVPVPGPNAAVSALSAAGLPTDRFVFEGFLPASGAARRKRLRELRDEPRTLVFYEAPHRIDATLADMAEIMGRERHAAIARELTKTFETIHDAPLGELLAWLRADANQSKGEFVVLLHGAPERDEDEARTDQVLRVLLTELPVKQAAALAAKITGVKKNHLYQQALRISDA